LVNETTSILCKIYVTKTPHGAYTILIFYVFGGVNVAVSEKRLYQRYFVILHQGDRGYGIPGGKEPTGYAKIEVRSNNGRMTALFQNLKQIDNNKGFYKVYMVSKSDGSVTPVKVGPVEVDQWGKGNVEWEFNPADVGGSGLDIEKFNIVTLAYIPEPLDKDISICFPLVGHLKKDTNVQWKEEVIKQLMAIAGIMPNIIKQKPEQEVTEQDTTEQDQRVMPCDKIEDEAIGGTGGRGETKTQVNGDTLSLDEVNVNWDTYNQNHGLPLGETDARADVEQSREWDIGENGRDNDTQVTGHKKADESGYYDTPRDEYDDKQGHQDELKKGYYGDQREGSVNRSQDRDGKQSRKYDDAQGKGYDGIREEGEKDAGTWGETGSWDKNRHASWYGADKGHGGYQSYGGYCFWDRMEWYYKRLFSSYMTVQPFDKEIKGVEWVRVDIQKSYNPAYTQNYFMNQFYGFMANPYDHYIIGIQQEDGRPKYIIYGMPGRYIREEQPFGGQTGYVYWHPAKGQKSYPGAFGYWMAYIDVISGTIAFPKKPTYL
jgi:hypothetical protein